MNERNRTMINQTAHQVAQIEKLVIQQRLMLDIFAAWETPGTQDFDVLNTASNQIEAASKLLEDAVHTMRKVAP